MLTRKYRIGSALKDGRFNRTSLPEPQQSHPPRRAEGLPTLTLEKFVPGGIAEVSPSYGGAGEGEGAPGCRNGSKPRPEANGL